MRRHLFSFIAQFKRKLWIVMLIFPPVCLPMSKINVELRLNTTDFGFRY